MKVVKFVMNGDKNKHILTIIKNIMVTIAIVNSFYNALSSDSFEQI